MDNLDIKNIAFGASLVALLDLIIIVLVKTETILKYIERIKEVFRLDYRSRAKRIDDEKRLLKKYQAVAQERIRLTFTSTELWDCEWVWSWSDNFEPENIRGFCTGNIDQKDGASYSFECNHPVNFGFAKGPEDKAYAYVYVGIYCSYGSGIWPHKESRAYFEIPTDNENIDPEKLIIERVKTAINSEKDKKVVREINKLRWQFWK